MVQIPPRLLVVPIVAALGLIGLAGRLGAGWLRRRRAGHRVPHRPAALLGWRRLTRHAAVTAALGAATALPIALALFGATITRSVHETALDESRLRWGSDAVMTLREAAPVPAGLADAATIVYRLDGAQIGTYSTDLLVVDPATFGRAAYWTDSLPGSSLAGLLARLRPGAGADMLASPPVPAGTQDVALPGGQPMLGGRARVSQAAVLPAKQGGFPVALTTRALAGHDIDRAEVQLWIRGDPAHIRAALDTSNLPVVRTRYAAETYGNTIWEPLTYTFDYLTALSLLTGAVTLVGLVLYLESQTPARRRAYVLLRRMGLRAGAHRGAVLRELAVPMAAGLVTGLAVMVALILAVRPEIEIDRAQPPSTVLSWPVLPAAALAALVGLTALGAALYAQRRIGRARPGEVLRDTA